MRNNRIYYRNPFFHIGHLQTLFYNDAFAADHGGKCYAIVDDRYHLDYKSVIHIDFEYLKLTATVLIPISEYAAVILNETKRLVATGRVYMLCGKVTYTNIDYILEALSGTPTFHFQLKLKSDNTTVGFTKDEDQDPARSGLAVVFLFEYIIKILDNVLGVTDITSDLVLKDRTAPGNFDQLATRKINVIPLKLYSIAGFRYVKKHWPAEALANPCLLTLKGMKARGIPCKVLRQFYEKALLTHLIRIDDLDSLLRTYLSEHALAIRGVMDPLKVDLVGQGGVDLDQPIYISKGDFGMDCPSKLNKNRSCQLRQGPRITCTEVHVNEKGVYLLTAAQGKVDQEEPLRIISWIPCAHAVRVRVYCYNWFFTGYNSVMNPVLYDAYLAEADLAFDAVYGLEGVGFIVRAPEPEPDGTPRFLCICKFT